MGNIFGEMLKYYRIKRGLSQRDLENAYYTRKHIGNVEKGKTIPTIEFVNNLSKLLSIDLYATYSKAVNFQSFEAFLLDAKINEAIKAERYSEVKELVSIAQERKDFAEGEAGKVLCYAKALLLSQDRNFEAALEMDKKGLDIHIDKPEFSQAADDNYSTIDNALYIGYVVNLARLGKEKEAVAVINEQISRLRRLLDEDIYVFQQNREMWLMALAGFTYNKYVLSISEEQEIKQNIDFCSSLMIKNKVIYLLPELLVAKAAILMAEGKQLEANALYKTAIEVGTLFGESESFAEKAKSIVNVKSDESMFKIY
ncbi:MAG: helix-turn-helix transcriptional regulator [Lachnospiraceae bacterium]|nr:helix-turn-helix transcriptional regulator [Lachnospiraceae bacterium]